MLSEALKYAAARLSGQRDTHGHLAELVALQARHARRAEDWAPHLKSARTLMLDAARACPQERRRTALIAGPGLLLEVPLGEIAALFARVVLVDMAFPPSVARAARELGNVEMLVRDLTGCLDDPPASPEAVPEVRLGLEPPDLAPPGQIRDLDFACSANLLSQLPLFVLRKIRGQGLPEVTLDAIAAAIVRAHLRWLSRLPCPACLLTDTVEHALPMQDSDLDEGHEVDLLCGEGQHLANLPGARRWTWDFALEGEELRGMDIRREVLGLPDVNASPLLPPKPPGGRP